MFSELGAMEAGVPIGDRKFVETLRLEIGTPCSPDGGAAD